MRFINWWMLIQVVHTHSTIFNRTIPLILPRSAIEDGVQPLIGFSPSAEAQSFVSGEHRPSFENLAHLTLDSEIDNTEDLLKQMGEFPQQSPGTPLAGMSFYYDGIHTTFLHHAFKKGRDDLVIPLLKSIQTDHPDIRGINFDIIASPQNKFPLEYVIEDTSPLKDHAEVATLLLQMNTNLGLASEPGYRTSALQYAMYHRSSLEIIKLILDLSGLSAGFDPDYIQRISICTSAPIGMAVSVRRSLKETEQLIQLLIEKGADINEPIFHSEKGIVSTIVNDFTRVINSFTPPMPNKKYKRHIKNRVKLLIKYGADLSIIDSQGYSPSDNARRNGNDFLIPLLTAPLEKHNPNITQQEIDQHHRAGSRSASTGVRASYSKGRRYFRKIAQISRRKN